MLFHLWAWASRDWIPGFIKIAETILCVFYIFSFQLLRFSKLIFRLGAAIFQEELHWHYETVSFGLSSLAGPACCMFGCCFLYYILTVSVRPIISTYTGPIFAKFSGLAELWLYMINLKYLKLVFRSLKGRCRDNQYLLALSTEQSSGDIR